MNNLKNAYAGFGMMGGGYGTRGDVGVLEWGSLVTVILIWTLLIVSIIAIMKYIAKD